MTTRVIANKPVEVNDEGFMLNPSQWTKAIAAEIAQEEGVGELTGEHWKVIDFCREDGVESGKSPTLRRITTNAGVSTKAMFALFPKGPAKKVARIAGLGKPEGCV